MREYKGIGVIIKLLCALALHALRSKEKMILQPLVCLVSPSSDPLTSGLSHVVLSTMTTHSHYGLPCQSLD